VAPSNIAVRVDASSRIGTGHLVRCLTLADELKRRGAHLRFLCGSLPDHCAHLVTRRGHELVQIPSDPLGSELVDAEYSAAALADRRWEWVVVDNYALGAAWETVMRALSARVFVIDDLANRNHDCDALLDQNYLPEGATRYLGKVPASCELFVGPEFALLHPDYRRHRQTLKARQGRARRLLVFFGGTDPEQMTELSLAALSSPGLSDLSVEFVCPGEPSRLRQFETLAAKRPNTVVHGARPSLADLMAQSDLFLGGGGTTTWERMCLGLPSLVITMAENQRQVVDCLAARGLVRLVGRSDTVTVDRIRDILLEEIQRDRPFVAIDEIMRLCDGLGTTRTVDAMLGPGRVAAVGTDTHKELQ
jgi:UDP-2,4-diacetamido-2,4,6-trideoxy-beta-L-altropyranose hydrolase